MRAGSAKAFRLGELAERLDAEVVGDANIEITGPGSLDSAGPGQISHLSHSAYRDKLPGTGASAVILRGDDLPACPTNALVVANPYHAFAKVSQLWEEPPPLNRGIHPSACVDSSAVVHSTARVGPGVVVGPHSVLGAGVRLYANAVLGPRCRLDEDVHLMANATLYADVKLGARTVVHAGSVVGADGFGFTSDANGRLEPIAQLGGVTVGCDVSIGSGTTIDRGTIDDTVIEDGVKIDNQVQVGHNCRIGAHTVVCGCVGMVGSTTIGRHCVLAGMVGIGGDGPIDICDGVTVSGVTHVSSSITEPGTYSGGILHNKMSSWKRNALRFQHLDELYKRIAWLERARSRGARGDTPRKQKPLSPGTPPQPPPRQKQPMSKAPPHSLDIKRLSECLPHRYPFLLVDRITELVRGERVKGFKNVTINEPFFAGHFPGAPDHAGRAHRRSHGPGVRGTRHGDPGDAAGGLHLLLGGNGQHAVQAARGARRPAGYGKRVAGGAPEPHEVRLQGACGRRACLRDGDTLRGAHTVSSVDARAIIDPDARLGADVEVGPWSIVGPGVEIGDGCRIDTHAVIRGPTRMGAGNRVFQFATIGEDTPALAYRGRADHAGNRGQQRLSRRGDRPSGHGSGQGQNRGGQQRAVHGLCAHRP